MRDGVIAEIGWLYWGGAAGPAGVAGSACARRVLVLVLGSEKTRIFRVALARRDVLVTANRWDGRRRRERRREREGKGRDDVSAPSGQGELGTFRHAAASHVITRRVVPGRLSRRNKFCFCMKWRCLHCY